MVYLKQTPPFYVLVCENDYISFLLISEFFNIKTGEFSGNLKDFNLTKLNKSNYNTIKKQLICKSPRVKQTLEYYKIL